MSLTSTSLLDAINIMLSAVGESPINSLEVSGLADVAIAKNVLNEVSRQVQEPGWHFNMEVDYPLPKDVSGNIPVPQNALRVDTYGSSETTDVVHRGTRLYDKKNHTYVFPADLKATIVFGLEFEELPQAARHYISIRAARIFQKRVLGSESKEKFSQEEEAMALAAMQSAEANNGDYNMLSDSWSVMSILER